MPRPLRIEYEGACYHVINRGNYRRNLFGEDGAGEAFERTLAEAAERYGWRLHAYVVMRNHFHLALELSEPNLSEGMKWLQGTWIRRYNVRRHLVGRPFQGRYKALLVEPGHAFGQVCHYIHLNPVRAGVVAAQRPASYSLSSLPRFPQRKNRPGWLDPITVLQTAGGLKDTAAGWRSYYEYLEFLATDEPNRKELVASRMSRGWCLGTKEFKQANREQAILRGAELDQLRYAGLEPERLRAERCSAWEEMLDRLAKAADVDLAHLGERKSDPAKVLLAAAMKQSTSVANTWLADRLQMGQPASASQFARRFLLDEKGRRSVEKLLSRVKT